MEIHLSSSLDAFYFGSTISEIVQILGRPSKINRKERTGFIVYYYNKMMTKFYFSIEEHKLITIETFHPDTYLWDRKVIGMRMSEIMDLLNERNLRAGPLEDYDTFEVIFCEEIWTVFCFEYDRLKSVEFSVLNEENGNYKWPQKH